MGAGENVASDEDGVGCLGLGGRSGDEDCGECNGFHEGSLSGTPHLLLIVQSLRTMRLRRGLPR